MVKNHTRPLASRNTLVGQATLFAAQTSMHRQGPADGPQSSPNHDLVTRAREAVCRTTGLTPPAPESMIGSIATLILPEPDAKFVNRPTIYDDPMQDTLSDNHRIQVPVIGLLPDAWSPTN